MTSRVGDGGAAPAPQVLREYALLADGERGILVGPRGEFAWMCFPRWDSEAVFSSLIGGAGTYAVTPRSRFVWGGYYEPGTLIWRSRWVTTDGIVECREALAAPGHARHAVILRRIIARNGDASLDIVLEPRAGFGRYPPCELTRNEDGTWSARTREIHLRWVGGPDARASRGGEALTLRLDLAEGEHHDLALVMSTTPIPSRAGLSSHPR